MKFQAIKGVRDILPPDSALWNRVEQTAREVFGTFGFAEIRLPVLERTELFARSIGVETDVVSKEMYTFQVIDPALMALDTLRHEVETRNTDPTDPVAVDWLMKEVDYFRKEFAKADVGKFVEMDPRNQA